MDANSTETANAKALAAVHLASGMTQSAVARLDDMPSLATIWRWSQTKEFQLVITEHREAAIANLVPTYVGLLDMAADVLAKRLKSTAETDQPLTVKERLAHDLIKAGLTPAWLERIKAEAAR